MEGKIPEHQGRDRAFVPLDPLAERSIGDAPDTPLQRDALCVLNCNEEFRPIDDRSTVSGDQLVLSDSLAEFLWDDYQKALAAEIYQRSPDSRMAVDVKGRVDGKPFPQPSQSLQEMAVLDGQSRSTARTNYQLNCPGEPTFRGAPGRI